jgi:predicted DNA-binding protein (MmcQ/YjbR family)
MATKTSRPKAKPKKKPTRSKPTSQKKAAPSGGPTPAVEKALRKLGLSWPETHEDFPWGHTALKVKNKAFAFMAHDGGEFSLSVKLPESNQAALTLPFTQPTEYGLGKSGWVSSRFDNPKQAPTELLCQWLEESYVAVAPTKLGEMLRNRHKAAVTSKPKRS